MASDGSALYKKEKKKSHSSVVSVGGWWTEVGANGGGRS